MAISFILLWWNGRRKRKKRTGRRELVASRFRERLVMLYVNMKTWSEHKFEWLGACSDTNRRCSLVSAPRCNSLVCNNSISLRECNRFACKNNGVLYENDLLQIGVKSEFRQNLGRLALYFGNKTAFALQVPILA